MTQITSLPIQLLNLIRSNADIPGTAHVGGGDGRERARGRVRGHIGWEGGVAAVRGRRELAARHIGVRETRVDEGLAARALDLPDDLVDVVAGVGDWALAAPTRSMFLIFIL